MKDFLRQLFSESGAASFSRAGALLALICACTWVTYLVWRTGALPSLEGLTLFITSLYALGKVNETVQRVMAKAAELRAAPPSSEAPQEAKP